MTLVTIGLLGFIFGYFAGLSVYAFLIDRGES